MRVDLAVSSHTITSPPPSNSSGKWNMLDECIAGLLLPMWIILVLGTDVVSWKWPHANILTAIYRLTSREGYDVL